MKTEHPKWMRSLVNRIESIRRRDSFLAIVAEAVRTILQALLLVASARILGAGSFGSIFAVVAALQFLQPLAWFGSWLSLVRIVARREMPIGDAASRSLTTVLVGGVLGAVAMTSVVAPLLGSDIEWPFFFLLALTELVGFGLSEILAYACIAERNFKRLIVLRFIFGSFRGLAVPFAMIASAEARDSVWIATYALTTLLAFGFSLLVVRRTHAVGFAGRPLSRRYLMLGLNFAVAGTATFAQDNLDKPIVLRLAGPVDAGIYAAGYRVVTVALVPVRAIMQSAYSRYFEYGADGLVGALQQSRRLAPVTVGYSLAIGLGMWVVAPLCGRLFGPGFEDVEEVVRLLAVLPLIRALGYLFGDAMTGSGRNLPRSILITAVSVGNIVLTIILVGDLGWEGAAIASIASDAVLVVLTCVYCVAAALRERAGQRNGE